MKIKLIHGFEEYISIDSLLASWQEFIKGKRLRADVNEFKMRLMDNIFELHNDLIHHKYKHGRYQAFNICDPKPRNIHKANVRDRILHRAVHRLLYPYYEKIFISDSYSCQIKKGTHKAVERFRRFAFQVSQNNTKTCWVLKCDIKKFFANIDHQILLEILKQRIVDPDVIRLLEEIIQSFSAEKEGAGLPLGNLTSQLFANVYMNELDQFIKRKLKVRHYIRYADDFVILSDNKDYLEQLLNPIQKFLHDRLKLEMHPDKISLKTLSSGIDFLGYINFINHRVLRTTTKKRVKKNLERKRRDLEKGLIPKSGFDHSLQSYLGILKHCDGYGLSRKYLNEEF